MEKQEMEKRKGKKTLILAGVMLVLLVLSLLLPENWLNVIAAIGGIVLIYYGIVRMARAKKESAK